MPAESALTPLGVKWRGWLPVALRDSPDHLAVLHAVAREHERLEAAIDTVRAQFAPQTADVLLWVYEAQLRAPVAPAGVSLANRRDTVIALMGMLRSTPAGRDWQVVITRLLGPGWTHEEHDPDDVGSPPANTIRVRLPGSTNRFAEWVFRETVPANIELTFIYEDVFTLDESLLDGDDGLA